MANAMIMEGITQMLTNNACKVNLFDNNPLFHMYCHCHSRAASISYGNRRNRMGAGQPRDKVVLVVVFKEIVLLRFLNNIFPLVRFKYKFK